MQTITLYSLNHNRRQIGTVKVDDAVSLLEIAEHIKVYLELKNFALLGVE